MEIDLSLQIAADVPDSYNELCIDSNNFRTYGSIAVDDHHVLPFTAYMAMQLTVAQSSANSECANLTFTHGKIYNVKQDYFYSHGKVIFLCALVYATSPNVVFGLFLREFWFEKFRDDAFGTRLNDLYALVRNDYNMEDSYLVMDANLIKDGATICPDMPVLSFDDKILLLRIQSRLLPCQRFRKHPAPPCEFEHKLKTKEAKRLNKQTKAMKLLLTKTNQATAPELLGQRVRRPPPRLSMDATRPPQVGDMPSEATDILLIPTSSKPGKKRAGKPRVSPKPKVAKTGAKSAAKSRKTKKPQEG